MMGPLERCCKNLAVECRGFPFCFLQVLCVLYGTSVSNRLEAFGDQTPACRCGKEKQRRRCILSTLCQGRYQPHDSSAPILSG